MAYQDSVGEINIDKIKAKITSTSNTNVFVYDTRKDSDGGAWRKKATTQSWYNEGASATRGARKEFPAVAVIVAERNFITIYDGDDPNLSMWMVFNTIAGGNSQGMLSRPMIQIQGVDKVVHMLNGILVTGTKNEGSNYGQPVINFINEKVLRMDSQTGEGGEWVGNIAQRNEALGYRSVDYDYVIKASRVNDVAMTVLPNARIDETTGLPIPTIAAGTESGLSIIRDDGNVYDHTGFSPVTSTNMGGDTVVVSLGRAGTINFLYKTNLPSADESFDTKITAGSGNFYMNSNTGTTPLLRYLDDTVESFKQLDGTVYRGGSKGFDIITNTETVSSTVNNSLIAYIDTDYNTGYMVGNIRSALLSSTDDTNIIGSGDGYVTGNDSTFGAVITSLNWSERSGSSGAWNVSGGVLKTGSVSAGEYLDITLSGYTSGQTHLISYTVSNKTGSNPIRWRYNNGQMGDLPSSNGTHHYYITLTETGTLFSLLNDANMSCDIDNFKIQLVSDDDRSVNNKGLVAYGTIEKHAVATGAELVGYRPDSSSQGTNYLKLPLNSSIFDLTGDWSISFWAKNNGNSAANYSGFEIAPDDITGNNGYSLISLSMYIQGDGFIGLRGMNGNANQDPTGYPLSIVGDWRCIHIVHRSGTTHLYIDGKLATSKSVSYTNPTTVYSLSIFRWTYSTTRHDG